MSVSDGWMDKENMFMCVCARIYIYIYTRTHRHIYTHIHTHNGILFSLKKEGNPAICDNMDEAGGHYAKWNRPDTERQILRDITYVESKIIKLTEAESRMLAARSWREGETGRYWSKGIKFQLRKMTKFWKSNIQQCIYCCTACLKFANRVDLKCSHHKKQNKTKKPENGKYVRWWTC